MAHSWSVTGGVKRNDGHSSDENFRPNANYTDDNRSGDYWHAATFPFIPDTVIPCGRSPYTSPYGATNRYNNTDGRTSAHCNREDTHRTGLDTESCAQRSMVDRPIRVFTCARGYTFREAIRESRIWNVGWKRRFGRLVLNPLTLPALLGRERFKRFLNEGGKKLPSFVKYSKYRFGHRLPPVEWKNLSVNSILCSIESNRIVFFSSSSFSWSVSRAWNICFLFLSLFQRWKERRDLLPRFRITFLVYYVQRVDTIRRNAFRRELRYALRAYMDIGKQLVCHTLDTWQRKGWHIGTNQVTNAILCRGKILYNTVQESSSKCLHYLKASPFSIKYPYQTGID